MEEEQQEVAPELEATAVGVTEEDTDQPEAEEAEGDSASEDKPKSRHQRRREATERAYREAEDARKEAEALRARLKEFEGSTPPKPQEKDFASYEEFNAALAGWHALGQLDGRERARMQRELQERDEQRQQMETRHRQEAQEAWGIQVAEARTRYADFDQVALAQSVPITSQMAEIIQTLDAGPDVAYHLGKNPADAQRISVMSPTNAAIELARIEARLSLPKPRTVTQAPSPVTPVKSAKASGSKDPDKMSASEYRAWREAGGSF